MASERANSRGNVGSILPDCGSVIQGKLGIQTGRKENKQKFSTGADERVKKKERPKDMVNQTDIAVTKHVQWMLGNGNS